MTRAVQVFKDNALDRARLEEDAAVQRDAAEADRSRRAVERAIAADEQADVVRRLSDGLKNLAAGDLRVRLGEGFPGRHAQIRDDFNAAIDRLKRTMLSVISSASAIHAGTHEISSASDDLSRRTEEHAASLEHTAAALNQITTTVKKSAEGATHARAVVVAAHQDARKGTIVVGQAVAATDAIAHSARQINQMDRVTQQNAAMVEESTAASYSLSQQTSQLAGLVGQFQVGRGGPDDAMRREPRRAAPRAFGADPHLPRAARAPGDGRIANLAARMDAAMRPARPGRGAPRAMVANGAPIAGEPPDWETF